MKKFLAAALASVMLVGGAALAVADGELNICSPNSDGLLSIIPVFEEQTGIKVNVESIGTGDCMKRIESEIAQEYSTFDLMYGGSLANYVANAGLFQDYVSEQDQYLMDAYKNTRGYCTNYTIDGSVLLVNTDMLKELGVEVNGYADLLQPELVGKIASADPASSSSAFCQLTNMLLAMGGYEDDAAWKYVEDLFVGQQVAITSGSSAVYKGVYNGEYAVGLTYEDPCVTLIKDGATNIQVVYPVEGTVFLLAEIGIVKNAKNVENAKAFVDFMLSEDAQRFLGENTTSRNVREVEYKNDVMTPLADIKLIYEDSDYVIAHTSELKEKVQDMHDGHVMFTCLRARALAEGPRLPAFLSCGGRWESSPCREFESGALNVSPSIGPTAHEPKARLKRENNAKGINGYERRHSF